MPATTEYLVLDKQTLKDLEIFESETEETSLFHFCNKAHTDGGTRILRSRMEAPFSSSAAIRETQTALAFIITHRSTFKPLHALAHTANRVEKYAHEILPVLTQQNPVEFGLAAISLWANHDRHYTGIALGVQFAARLIRSLRTFVEQPAFDNASGAIASLTNEIKDLLATDALKNVPDDEVGGSWAIRTLRLDQVFRLHASDEVRRLLVLIYELDALLAMADVTKENNWVFPTVLDGDLQAHGEALRHPFVENPVGNPLEIDQKRRVMFLTGPNMAGKTTYLRSVATALYLGHLGMGVPATDFQFSPADRLFSSISLSDDLRGGISYFRAEALRVKAIASAMAQGHRVIAVMDEPFKGTNVKDALDASLAILERFAERSDCITLFSSHLIELNEQMSNNEHLSCRHFGAMEEKERLQFDYTLKEGVSSQRLGMRVLKEEGIFDLLDGEV